MFISGGIISAKGSEPVRKNLIDEIDLKSKEKTHLQNTMIRRGMEIFIRAHEELGVIPPLVDVKPTKSFVGLWAKCDKKRIICSAYPVLGYTLWELYPDFNIPRKRQLPKYLDDFYNDVKTACKPREKLGLYPKQRSSSSHGGYVRIKIPDLSWTKNTREIDTLFLDFASITYTHMINNSQKILINEVSFDDVMSNIKTIL